MVIIFDHKNNKIIHFTVVILVISNVFLFIAVLHCKCFQILPLDSQRVLPVCFDNYINNTHESTCTIDFDNNRFVI